jgi:hypothetical protein
MHPSEPTSAAGPANLVPGPAQSEAQAALEQLERLLANSHIHKSKRCHALLKHIVEKAASGSVDCLKERTLGRDVFHREPDYDTNQDSIVRTTAAEIRKRLAQYYLEPGHEREMRIALPAGSYVPEFRPAPPLAEPYAAPPPVAPNRRRRWLWGLAVALPVALGGALLAFRSASSPLDRLWRPAVADSSEVVICVGQPSRLYWFDGERRDELNAKMIGGDTTPPAPLEVRQHTSLRLDELRTIGERYCALGDLVAAMRIGELLGRKNKKFRVLGEKTAAYRDLRGRPVVLIGLSNNKWTLSLISQMRYYFDRHDETGRYEIRDRKDSGKAIVSATRGDSNGEEFAIVCRVYSSTLEKQVYIVAGLADRSTSAGAEFLTNESYLREAFARAPSGWEEKNIQIVLKTDLVGGTAGPPTVVAAWFW